MAQRHEYLSEADTGNWNAAFDVIVGSYLLSQTMSRMPAYDKRTRQEIERSAWDIFEGGLDKLMNASPADIARFARRGNVLMGENGVIRNPLQDLVDYPYATPAQDQPE